MLYFRFFPNAGEYRFFSWCAFDGLALGCLAALLYVRNEAAASRLGAALGAAGLAGTCLLALRHSLGRASLLGTGFQASVVYLCCAGLLLGAVSGQVGILKFLFRNRALAFLGQISYGLYLYHVIFLEKLTYTRPLPAAWPGFAAEANDMVFRVIWPLGAAVAAAFLSRISIEEYFLRRKSRLAPRP
jgi:peptidoglycan/LPS O-acetylase OafA/YrhL